MNEKRNVLSTKSDSWVYESIRTTLVEARNRVYTAINTAMVSVYWEIGQKISEAVGDRAEYGKQLLQFLSLRLTKEFGKGFTVANLRNMRQFYQMFSIRYTLCSELSWSHYRILMRIDNTLRREYYTKECIDCGWTVRQLERQVNSFYYERLLATQASGKESVKNEIHTLEPKTNPTYLLFLLSTLRQASYLFMILHKLTFMYACSTTRLNNQTTIRL